MSLSDTYISKYAHLSFLLHEYVIASNTITEISNCFKLHLTFGCHRGTCVSRLE